MSDRASDRATTGEHPADQLLSLSLRTLWVLYGAFCVSILIYAGIMAAFTFMTAPAPEAGLPDAARLEQSWGARQFLVLVLGLAAVAIAFRLAGRLQRTDRLWAGTQSLNGLAATLAPGGGPGGDQASPDQRHQALTRAVQHLLGRVVMAHLIPWLIAEVPAILGILDRFLGGDRWLWMLMILLSAVTLAAQRPSRERLRGILEPIYRAPVHSS